MLGSVVLYIFILLVRTKIKFGLNLVFNISQNYLENWDTLVMEIIQSLVDNKPYHLPLHWNRLPYRLRDAIRFLCILKRVHIGLHDYILLWWHTYYQLLIFPIVWTARWIFLINCFKINRFKKYELSILFIILWQILHSEILD